MNETRLNVHSIFHSIDGEVNGFYGAGQLCTFIRLKGCNLNCRWCDTKYAQESEPANWMTISEIVNQIKFPKVTITGGEAFLQRHPLGILLSRLLDSNCKISIETNGSIPIFYWEHRNETNSVWDSKNIRYVVDYKLPSSEMEHKMNLKVFEELRDIDIIKFVISDWNDYNRALKIIEDHLEWRARPVFSPAIKIIYPAFSENSYSEDSIEPAVDITWPRQLVEKMLKDRLDIQFSLQIHKILWPGATEER